MAEGPVEGEVLAAGAIAASADRSGTGTSGQVALRLDGSTVALDIVDGRVVGTVATAEAAVAVPLGVGQLKAILAGSESMAQAFIRGDIKPEGATGPFLALIELFEDAEFRQRLAASIVA